MSSNVLFHFCRNECVTVTPLRRTEYSIVMKGYLLLVGPCYFTGLAEDMKAAKQKRL